LRSLRLSDVEPARGNHSLVLDQDSEAGVGVGLAAQVSRPAAAAGLGKCVTAPGRGARHPRMPFSLISDATGPRCCAAAGGQNGNTNIASASMEGCKARVALMAAGKPVPFDYCDLPPVCLHVFQFDQILFSTCRFFLGTIISIFCHCRFTMVFSSIKIAESRTIFLGSYIVDVEKKKFDKESKALVSVFTKL
jgi:hypothetical protein